MKLNLLSFNENCVFFLFEKFQRIPRNDTCDSYCWCGTRNGNDHNKVAQFLQQKSWFNLIFWSILKKQCILYVRFFKVFAMPKSFESSLLFLSGHRRKNVKQIIGRAFTLNRMKKVQLLKVNKDSLSTLAFLCFVQMATKIDFHARTLVNFISTIASSFENNRIVNLKGLLFFT